MGSSVREGRDRERHIPERSGGPTLLERKRRIVFHLMLREKRQVLLLKRFRPMMFLLIPNVIKQSPLLTLRHRERRVFGLPGERRIMVLVNPARRVGLQRVDDFGERDGGGHRNVEVDVILDAAGEEGAGEGDGEAGVIEGEDGDDAAAAEAVEGLGGGGGGHGLGLAKKGVGAVIVN